MVVRIAAHSLLLLLSLLSFGDGGNGDVIDLPVQSVDRPVVSEPDVGALIGSSSAAITAADIDVYGRYVVFATSDGQLSSHDVSRRQTVNLENNGRRPITSLALDPLGGWVLSSRDGAIERRTLGSVIETHTLPSEDRRSVSSIRVSTLGRYCAVARDDGLVELWQTSDWRLLWSFRPSGEVCTSLSLCDEPSMLVTGCSTGEVVAWDVRTRAAIATIAHASSAVQHVDLASDAGLVIFVAGRACIASTDCSSLVGRLTVTGLGPGCVSMDSSGRYLAWISEGEGLRIRRCVTIMELSTGRIVGGLYSPEWNLKAVRISQDGSRILCVLEHSLYLWDWMADCCGTPAGDSENEGAPLERVRGDDPVRAIRAMLALCGDPGSAESVCAEMAAGPDGLENVVALISELESDVSSVRESAENLLGECGSEWAVVLEEHTADLRSYDARHRLKRIVDAMQCPGPLLRDSERMRVRLIEVLERIGARGELESLLQLRRSSPLTRESRHLRSACERLRAKEVPK